MLARSVPAQERPYTPLVHVVAEQPEFLFEDIEGVLVGFWSPEYLAGLNVPGYHLHFISHDRLQGGHLLACGIEEAVLEVASIHDFQVMLPQSEEFSRLDLLLDTAEEIKTVETEQRTLAAAGDDLDAEAALWRLMEGNRRYVEGSMESVDLSEQRRTELVAGQNPFAVVIGCSDSRVPPEHLFQQGLGELFVIRLAGNIIDHLAIGSVEYAVAELAVPLIVVLGHEDCGAVRSAVKTVLDGVYAGGSIDTMLEKITPIVSEVIETIDEPCDLLCDTVTELNVAAVIQDLCDRVRLSAKQSNPEA